MLAKLDGFFGAPLYLCVCVLCVYVCFLLCFVFCVHVLFLGGRLYFVVPGVVVSYDTRTKFAAV